MTHLPIEMEGVGEREREKERRKENSKNRCFSELIFSTNLCPVFVRSNLPS